MSAVRNWSSTLTSCACATRTGYAASTTTGWSLASVSSASPSPCGTASMKVAKSITRRSSPPVKINFLSIPHRIPLPVTPRISAESPVASWANSTSWTPGQPLPSPRRSPAAGWKTRTCSLVPTRWTCVHRARTSSEPGCSQRSCAQIWNSVRSLGHMPVFPDGSWTRITRRCRSLRAMS